VDSVTYPIYRVWGVPGTGVNATNTLDKVLVRNDYRAHCHRHEQPEGWFHLHVLRHQRRHRAISAACSTRRA
jgi:hypothetical protein